MQYLKNIILVNVKYLKFGFIGLKLSNLRTQFYLGKHKNKLNDVIWRIIL